MITGTVDGLGFSPANRTWVFADLDTDADQPIAETSMHREVYI
jgi:hypothetical protein